jgi:hypothetical protein
MSATQIDDALGERALTTTTTPVTELNASAGFERPSIPWKHAARLDVITEDEKEDSQDDDDEPELVGDEPQSKIGMVRDSPLNARRFAACA